LVMRDFSSTMSCGTAYCAAGWARLDLVLQNTTRICEAFDVSDLNKTVYFSRTALETFGVSEEGEGLLIMTVLGIVFGISDEDADNLFGGELSFAYGEYDVSKEEVLENIDRILRGEPAIPYEALTEENERRGRA